MPYSPDFFRLQLSAVDLLVARFGLPLAEAVREYTTFTRCLGDGDEWDAYIAGLEACKTRDERTEWTYRWYEPRSGADPTTVDAHFHGHRLFGCFYYQLREEGRILRIHLIKNDRAVEQGVLGREERPERRQELTALFTDLAQNVPQAETILGNSWMYNLRAYRSLFPPEYSASLPVSTEDEFPFLSRWGQFFDHRWRVKEPLAEIFVARLNALERLENLRWCFPYQILRPECPVRHFYDFYGVTI